MCPFFQNNKVDFFSPSYMLWGDTILVCWESLRRFDCTSFSRFESKIQIFTNLFLVILLQKRVSEVGTSLFLFPLERLIFQRQNFFEIYSNSSEFEKLVEFFGEISRSSVLNGRMSRKEVTFKKKTHFPKESVTNHSLILQNHQISSKNSVNWWNSRKFERILKKFFV